MCCQASQELVEDVLISSEDIPGWAVASDGDITVALDVNVTDELRQEGIARDFVNRIQNMRKTQGLEVLDKIRIDLESKGAEQQAIQSIRSFTKYISEETQALSLDIREGVTGGSEVDMDDFVLQVRISKA